jgi:superfamily II helicase
MGVIWKEVVMNSDETKIMTHLLSRTSTFSNGVDLEEIRSAWAFEDFEGALESLLDQKFIVRTGGPTVRMTASGKKALKKA